MSPDGRSAVLGGRGGSYLWKHADNVGPIKLAKSRGDAVTFAPNGRVFSTVGTAPHLWDAATGELIAHFQAKDRGSYSDTRHGIAFSPDSRMILVGHADGASHLWKLPEPAIIGDVMEGKAQFHCRRS